MAKKPKHSEYSRIMLDPDVADAVRAGAERLGMHISPFVRLCLEAFRQSAESGMLPSILRPAAAAPAPEEPKRAPPTPITIEQPPEFPTTLSPPRCDPLIEAALHEAVSRDRERLDPGHEIARAVEQVSSGPMVAVEEDVGPASTEPAPPDLTELSEKSAVAREALQTSVDGLIAAVGEAAMDPDVLGAAWDVAASRRGVDIRAEEAMGPALSEIYRVALEDVSHGDAEIALNVVMHWFDLFLDVGEVDPRILHRSIDTYRDRLPDPDMPPWTAEGIVAEAMEL